MAGIVGVAAGIFFQRRADRIRDAKQLKQKALEIEKDLIVKREFFVPLPRNQVIPAIERQLAPDWVSDPDSSGLVGSFRPYETAELRRTNPELWEKIASLMKSGQMPKVEEILREYIRNYYQNLRSTTPAEVRVRVEGENQSGESRCVAECRPVFYKRVVVPEFGKVKGDLMVQAQAAKIECRTLLEDLIVQIGGRKDWQSTMNLT